MNGKRAKRIAQAAILALSLLTPFLPTQVLQSLAAQKADAAFEQQLAAEGFPESYKQKLRELHAKYPNWEFKAYQTGLSWQEVVREESKLGRNLVHTTSKDSWKSKDAAAYNASTNTWKGFDTSAWVAANPDIIGYYMDPRNFLDGRYVFQFQTQGYDPASQNAEGVRMLAANSFLTESGASIVGSRSAVENQSSSADSGISEATKVAGASGKSPSAVLWAAPGTLRDSENVQVGEAPLSEQEQQSRAATNGSRPAVPTRGETATKQEVRAIGVLAGAPRDRLAASEAVQGESVSDAESSAENTDPVYGEVQPVDVDSASGLSDISTGQRQLPSMRRKPRDSKKYIRMTSRSRETRRVSVSRQISKVSFAAVQPELRRTARLPSPEVTAAAERYRVTAAAPIRPVSTISPPLWMLQTVQV